MSEQDLLKRAEKAEADAQMWGRIVHNMVVANQSAWIEWRHGKGADQAMAWIHNGLVGPGHIPGSEAENGKEPQAWYDANIVDHVVGEKNH